MNAGLSCNFAGFSLLHLFPFLPCLVLQCMQGKQFYDMVSTLNLQPPCMKTAGGLPAQFFAFKVWNLVFKFVRFEYFITDWCKFAFALRNQLSFSNLTLSI